MPGSYIVAGADVPAIGLGTYGLRGRECIDVVETALDLGYRHIDTAEFYDNQSEIGDRYEKSAAQVALRWLVQQPMVAAIPKASSREHSAANLDIFDFDLTDAEMERIFAL